MNQPRESRQSGTSPTTGPDGTTPEPADAVANRSTHTAFSRHGFLTVLELAEKYAHLAANPCTGPYGALDRDDFDAYLAAYGKHFNGRVDGYFFCVNLPAGVIYTSDDSIHLTFPPDAWAPNWLSELLMQCQMLYVEIRHAPLWKDRRICLNAIFDVMCQLLRMMGNEDWRLKRLARMAARRTQTDANQIVTIKAGHDCDFEIGTISSSEPAEWQAPPWTSRETAYRAQIGRALEIVERSALKYAQFIYFLGMIFVLPLLIVSVSWIAQRLGAMNLVGLQPGTIDAWTICAAAGAIGAIVSVMQRISADECPLRWRAGWELLFLMGCFRPIVGAVIAVVVVLAIQAKLLPVVAAPAGSSLYFQSVVAFFAGFSERFARDMLAAAPAQLSLTPTPAEVPPHGPDLPKR